MDVSDVLRDRLHEPAGLERMAIVSLLVHTAMVAGLVLAPGAWLSPSKPVPRTVMTISLSGGNGGPNNGGMTSISQRPVQAEPLAEAPKRPEPVRPPAAVTPQMTVPIPSKTPPRPVAKPAAKPAAAAAVVQHAPNDARGRTPTRGTEMRQGNAIAETGARGQGFGLSTSGGTGTGSTLDIVGDFCCPEYLGVMTERIRTNWNPVAEVAAIVIIKYTIQRDGTIVDASIERSGGYPALDFNALRAVLGTRQLPALPAAFPNPSLTVHLNFQYKR